VCADHQTVNYKAKYPAEYEISRVFFLLFFQKIAVEKVFSETLMAFMFLIQKHECRKKVWKKGVEFEEGKKNLS
jgi:hypothetical protein